MSYRTYLQATTSETVQEMSLAATQRLKDAMILFAEGRYHTAIYIGGLAAEMLLKTACFFLGGATPADDVRALMTQVKQYNPPYKKDWESGHGLWFWSQELLGRRRRKAKLTPGRFRNVMAALYNDWFIEMRYRAGRATDRQAAAFLQNVEWLAENHAALRR